MTLKDRDRLVVLKKAQKRLITQREAAEELRLTERHARRLLRRLKQQGDCAVLHGLRGRVSNRRLSEKQREKAIRILSREVYRGFGPTLAAEYLAKKHGLKIGRETVRKLMIGARLWQGRRRKVETVHVWRERRHSRGEMVQWDTSDHDWLEGRGERFYLIHMIDDATSELTARFVAHDSTEENMRLLKSYLERHGRPVAFYTDKASLFQTALKIPRDQKPLPRDQREPLPPTQIGRALRELGIVWIAAHSPQAKGRVERSFQTAQDRLVKGLRVAGAKTLEQANRYLQEEFVPWWNQHLKRLPKNPTDAHRRLAPEHDLDAILSVVETRQVTQDYTIRFESAVYQIGREDIRAGLRGANVRVEVRLDSSLRVRFQDRYLAVSRCQQPPKLIVAVSTQRKSSSPLGPSRAWRQSQDQLFSPSAIPLWKAARIDRTRTSDSLEEGSRCAGQNQPGDLRA
jgi:DNA-binding Lrp family transcriptional regulator